MPKSPKRKFHTPAIPKLSTPEGVSDQIEWVVDERNGVWRLAPNSPAPKASPVPKALAAPNDIVQRYDVAIEPDDAAFPSPIKDPIVRNFSPLPPPIIPVATPSWLKPPTPSLAQRLLSYVVPT